MMPNQYWWHWTNMRRVGAKGDFRTYRLRCSPAKKTIDFMTAESAEIPYAVLNKLANRIINEAWCNRILMTHQQATGYD